MNIIIIGCGNVGEAITEQLSAEGNDITVIDKDEKRVAALTSKYDVMGIAGNGAVHSVQQEAGIEQADLVIAVTASDELNLLCCMVARKAGKCHTVARVRSPEYSQEAPYLQEELRLAMVINPEYAAAEEMARTLRLPEAAKAQVFSNGRLELVKFRIQEGNILSGCAVKELDTKIKCSVLVCMIERDGEVIIPGGDAVLKEGDIISVAASHENAGKFFRKIGCHKNPVKNVIIAGGGDVALYLSEILLKSGISVKIIEKNENRCTELCSMLSKADIICADASDKETLLEEGLEYTDAFVALTSLDEENILLSLFAEESMKGKVITKVNCAEYDSLLSRLNLDSVVNLKEITAECIVRFVRAMKNSIGSNVETLYTLSKGKAEAAEFRIGEDSPVTGVPLSRLKFKSNVLIAAITRQGKTIFPRGNDTIEAGDSVVVVSKHLGLCAIRDILA